MRDLMPELSSSRFGRLASKRRPRTADDCRSDDVAPRKPSMLRRHAEHSGDAGVADDMMDSLHLFAIKRADFPDCRFLWF